jgi:hypothetical protein
VSTVVFLQSQPFSVKAWSARGSIRSSKLSVLEERATVFEVMTEQSSIKVCCRFIDLENPMLLLNIQLVCMDKVWSLGRVSTEIKRKDKRPRLRMYIQPLFLLIVAHASCSREGIYQ